MNVRVLSFVDLVSAIASTIFCSNVANMRGRNRRPPVRARRARALPADAVGKYEAEKAAEEEVHNRRSISLFAEVSLTLLSLDAI